MSLRCPVCETENADDAADCGNCGKILATEAALFADVEPVPGLELTLQRPVETETQTLAELEQTQLAPKDLPVQEEHVPGVEYTQLEQDPAAPLNWTPGNTPIDLGRELDDGERTPAPQDTGTCPWCGAVSTDAVCDACGRRRSRYTAAAAVVAVALTGREDNVMCPACFARVPPGPRCTECGTPFPVPEL